MKVKIISMHDHDNYENEYVLIEVLKDCDIGEHMLADSTYKIIGKISNRVPHTYWFPDKDVKNRS